MRISFTNESSLNVCRCTSKKVAHLYLFILLTLVFITPNSNAQPFGLSSGETPNSINTITHPSSIKLTNKETFIETNSKQNLKSWYGSFQDVVTFHRHGMNGHYLNYFTKQDNNQKQQQQQQHDDTSSLHDGHRRLGGHNDFHDMDIIEFVSTLADTPMDEWSGIQFVVFFALLLLLGSLALCCCCSCLCRGMGGGRCCRGGGSCCQDILMCFCCYEICCRDGQDLDACCPGPGVYNLV